MATSNDAKRTRATTLSERVRRGDLCSPDCPSREVLKHVTSLWGVLVLIALRDGTHRFSDCAAKPLA